MGGGYQKRLNNIIARTRKSGFEQALTVFAYSRSGSLTVRESKQVEQSQVNRGFSDLLQKGLRPLIAIHTHAPETEFDLQGMDRYFEGTYFVPSPDDMEESIIFDEEGRQFINLVDAMIVTTSTPRVWMWQVPNERIQNYASRAVRDWFKDISRDITESDILDLVNELISVGLKLHVGNLTSNNPAKSFVEMYMNSGLVIGYSG